MHCFLLLVGTIPLLHEVHEELLEHDSQLGMNTPQLTHDFLSLDTRYPSSHLLQKPLRHLLHLLWRVVHGMHCDLSSLTIYPSTHFSQVEYSLQSLQPLISVPHFAHFLPIWVKPYPVLHSIQISQLVLVRQPSIFLGQFPQEP